VTVSEGGLSSWPSPSRWECKYT